MSRLSLGLRVNFPRNAARLLQREIARELVARMNRRIPLAINRMTERLKDLVRDRIKAAPEYQSLLAGKLRGQLGIPEGAIGEVDQVVEAVADGMEVSYTTINTSGNGFTGGITVRILRQDNSEVFSRVRGSFVSEKGHNIEWLNWLLTKGDSILVVDYVFTPKATRASRTGLGVMARRPSGTWRVPPEFSGTLQDNWLVRSLKGMEPEIERILSEEVIRVIG